MKLCNYSLNHAAAFTRGDMDVFRFLRFCRQLNLDAASLHIRQLASTEDAYLKKVRRAYLDEGLSVGLFTVTTDFGKPKEQLEGELEKAREAVRVALFLGAPLLRVFAGSPPTEAERDAAFQRAVAGVRRVCEEAAQAGLPIGLQNHNHGALCRTGEEVLRFIKQVDHSNLTFVLDTGQWAGSKGASGPDRPELKGADPLESIRQTASLARYVRVKFYRPGPDGAEPAIDYARVFDILRSVHYSGILDIVYEPDKAAAGPGAPEEALPRIVAFLRGHMRVEAAPREAAPSRYSGLTNDRFFPRPQVVTETAVAFLEGPAADREGNVYFTNIPADQILRWDAKKRNLSVFRDKSNGANGLRFDRQGRLVVCEGNGRVTRIEPKTGQGTVLADQYDGKPLGAPNDLALDQEGRIYFTSRLSNRDPKTGNVNAVYRIDPDGKLTRILAAPAIDMPNGIVTSPDDRILYLIDADGRENHARRIRAYELRSDGTVGKESLLYDFYPGRSGDGMAIDAEGNLYVAAGLHQRRGSSETLDTRPGVHVISPQGRLLAFLQTPEDTVTNCTFGGPDLRTLYVTCGKVLLSVPTRIPGKGLYRPES